MLLVCACCRFPIRRTLAFFSGALLVVFLSSVERPLHEAPGLAPLALHIPENGRQPNLHPVRHWHAPGRGRRKHWGFWVT